jgi:hypothetical protein
MVFPQYRGQFIRQKRTIYQPTYINSSLIVAVDFNSLFNSGDSVFRHVYHVILFASITLLGCGEASVTSTSPSQVTNNQIVGVSGNQMTLNDAPWLSRGIVLQGFVRPLAALQANSDTSQQAKEDLQARMNYGATELAAIKSL